MRHISATSVHLYIAEN